MGIGFRRGLVYPTGVCAFRGKGEVETLRENDEAERNGKKMKMLGEQLIKLKFVKKAVEDHNAKQQKQRDDQLFARLMSANHEYRHVDIGRGDALGVVTLEEYRGGKVVDRESMILDSTNWGGMKL